jgi:hypothetical protein
MHNDDVEARIVEFEDAWRQGGPCDLSGFLDRPPELPAGQRAWLLVELVCIDLEFRWRDWPKGRPDRGPATLESYVARYPELSAVDRFPLEVVGQEYRVRRQWGDRPTHADFLSRFPDRQGEIRAELTRIDRELRDESSGSGGMRPCGKGSTTSEDDVAWDDEVAPIAHRDVLLQRMIGSGRTGKVYEAWQRSAGRPVAVKFLRKSFLGHPEIVRRFVQEAGTVARLRHPNLVEVHGFGRTPAGGRFLVMELVDGPNLDHVARSAPIPAEAAVRWTIEACKALEHAHARGTIHCDLKPANLLLDRAGRIRVTDFGLSRSLDGPTSRTAEIEGTAPYMAPEQASRYWGEIGVRTDVYGLGAVLFALLTGRPPWLGRSLPDILADVMSAAPVVSPADLRPDLSGAVCAVCRTSLSKPPKDRYPTVQRFREALTEIGGVERSR